MSTSVFTEVDFLASQNPLKNFEGAGVECVLTCNFSEN